MKKLFLIVLWVGFCFSLPVMAGEEFELVYPQISGQSIWGNFKSRDGDEFNFEFGGIFTYKLYAKDSLHDGAYEGSSCAVKNRKTGEVLHQGNFMFYFNGTSCCYNVKLVGEKLLVLSRIWTKDHNELLCPNSNLRVVPKK